MKYLFIGEKRSQRAIEMNVRWENGMLSAKTLFDALREIGIDPEKCKYMNIFEPLKQQGILHKEHTFWIMSCRVNGYIPVAMGRKVEKELKRLGVEDFKFIYHPAARGLIRTKSRYIKHVKTQLA